MLIDSHCHVYMADFDADRAEVLARARSAGLGALIVVGYDLPSSRQAVDLAARESDVYACVAIHPHHAADLTPVALAELEALASRPKVVGIGEIGLDFFRNLAPRDAQEAAFRAQLRLADALRLPQQIADELHVSLSTVYRALGLQNEMWSMWLENAAGILMVILLLVSPLVFMRGLHDFADMPQRVFIQTAAAVLVMLWALRVLISREIAIPRSTLCWVVAALIVWSFLTLLWATNVYEGLYSTIHLAMCGVVFFAIITILRDEKWVSRMLTASTASAALVLITGLAQQYLQLKYIPQSVSPTATFGNPNVAADYLVIVLPSLIAMGVAQKKMLYRWFLFTALILSLIYLYNTHSRGGWLAIFCAALSMGLLYVVKKYNRVFIKRGLTIAVILFACLLPAILFPASGKRILNAALSEYRLTAWTNSTEMIRDKPVQGFGAGNFKIFYPAYSNRAVVDRVPDTTRYLGRAHNDFIQIAVELGIPGFLFFVLIQPAAQASGAPGAAAPSAPPKTLPKTASPVPLAGLAGFLLVGAGLALRSFRSRGQQ